MASVPASVERSLSARPVPSETLTVAVSIRSAPVFALTTLNRFGHSRVGCKLSLANSRSSTISIS